MLGSSSSGPLLNGHSSITKAEPQEDTTLDELNDDDFESDIEDPNVFVIRDPLEVPKYHLFTTAQLHSEKFDT